LNNAEVAATLESNESTAGSRYQRTLTCLKDEAQRIPALLET
jgi:hypothetical protein